MKIRCIIRRKAGSSQTIDGVTYRWNDQNDHVCEVANDAHAEKLLAHPESWVAEGAVETGEEGAQTSEKPTRGRRRKQEAEASEEGAQ
jgi:hypothetical protein